MQFINGGLPIPNAHRELLLQEYTDDGSFIKRGVFWFDGTRFSVWWLQVHVSKQDINFPSLNVLFNGLVMPDLNSTEFLNHHKDQIEGQGCTSSHLKLKAVIQDTGNHLDPKYLHSNAASLLHIFS